MPFRRTEAVDNPAMSAMSENAVDGKQDGVSLSLPPVKTGTRCARARFARPRRDVDSALMSAALACLSLQHSVWELKQRARAEPPFVLF